MKKYLVPILFSILALLLVLGGCDFLPGAPEYNDMNNPLDKYDPNDNTGPLGVTALTASWEGTDAARLAWMPPTDLDYAGVQITWSPPTNMEQPQPWGSNQDPNIQFYGFNQNTVYVFTVSTFDFNENPGGSMTFTLNPITSTVLPVDNLQATYDQVNHNINVTWQNPSDYVAGVTTIAISTNYPTDGEIVVSDGSTQAVVPVTQFGVVYTINATARRNGMVSENRTAQVDVLALVTDPLRVGLVGEWLFESGSTNDTSGNNYHATAYGSFSAGLDRFSSDDAMHLETESSYLSAGAGALPTGGGSRTLSAWVKLDDYPTTEGVVFQYGDLAFVVSQNGYPGFDGGGSSGYCSDPQDRLALNAWYHIALVYDSGNMTIVVNSRDAGAWGATLNSSTATGLFMGGNIRGYIDDMRIYSRVLQPAEVDQLHRVRGYYNTSSDFPMLYNPTGSWAFGNIDDISGLTGFAAMNVGPVAGLDQATWYYSADPHSSVIWMNRGTAAVLGVAPGLVALRPDLDMAPARQAVLRWIAPESGTYSLAIDILPSVSADTTAAMYVNGTLNPADDFGVIGAAFHSAGISKTVNAGDHIDIVVDGTMSTSNLDTPVSITIQKIN